MLLASEYARPGTRGLWASAAQTGVPLGSFLANLMVLALAAGLSPEAFLSWGWRVAFLLSLALVAFGLWIRIKLEETPVFQAVSYTHLDVYKRQIPEQPEDQGAGRIAHAPFER